MSNGSLLIWDTGSYRVLPSKRQAETTDDELSSSDDVESGVDSNTQHENEKLITAFHNVSGSMSSVHDCDLCL